VHRDLKLQNVVMKDNMTPILIDFDVSKDVAYATRTSATMVGTVDVRCLVHKFALPCAAKLTPATVYSPRSAKWDSA
jgi:hypothetical protein